MTEKQNFPIQTFLFKIWQKLRKNLFYAIFFWSYVAVFFVILRFVNNIIFFKLFCWLSQIIISFIETETTPESFDINAKGAFYCFDKKWNLKYFLVFVLVQKVFVNVILDLEYIIFKRKNLIYWHFFQMSK